MTIQQRETNILILGGGFAGMYAALELEKSIRRDPSVKVTLVNRDNFFLFTPMLHEVAASDLDLTAIVSPIHQLLKRVSFFCGDVDQIDLEQRQVTVSHGAGRHAHTLSYDQLVIATGSVTNYNGLPGVEVGSYTMRSLDDATQLRNHVIAMLEEANFDCARDHRASLLTFVVAGGGFAGVETVTAMNDFVSQAIRYYPNLSIEDVRMVLVHSGKVILPELDGKLGQFTEKKIAQAGIEVRTSTRVASYNHKQVALNDGTLIPAETLVWTAGTSPNPLVAALPCEKNRGRIVVDSCLRVPSHPGVWAVGDCAFAINEETGAAHPPTAQHASREGRQLGRNILATLQGRPARPFRFNTLGQLATIGRRNGVARIFGVNFSGFIAWFLWRTIYLLKLPRFEKKVRVALDWTLDLVFSKDIVQYLPDQERTAVSADAADVVGQERQEQGDHSNTDRSLEFDAPSHAERSDSLTESAQQIAH